MIIVNFDEYNIHRKAILSDIPKSVFIYPTDTIYGIGCSALDGKLVDKIRKIKGTTKPFSIIVPSKEWIYENCVITEEVEEWVRKLPGPYTLVLKLKNSKAVSPNVYNNDAMTVGVRMPNHWFLGVSYSLKLPIVTTSVNFNGENFMTSLDDIDTKIRNSVDYIFYDGKKNGTPSTIINLTDNSVKIQKRDSKSSRKNVKFPIEELNSLKK